MSYGISFGSISERLANFLMGLYCQQMHEKYFLLAELVVDEPPRVSPWDLILKGSFEAEQMDHAVHDPSPEEVELVDQEDHSYSAETSGTSRKCGSKHFTWHCCLVKRLWHSDDIRCYINSLWPSDAIRPHTELSLSLSQHRLRWWLAACRHLAIIRTNLIVFANVGSEWLNIMAFLLRRYIS